MEELYPATVESLTEVLNEQDPDTIVSLKLYDIDLGDYIELPLEFAHMEHGELKLFGIL